MMSKNITSVRCLFAFAIVTLPLVHVVGCGFYYEKRITGKYALVAVDVKNQMAVCEVLPRGGANVVISETVFAVGWDEHFIIAKQHRFLGGEILRDTTNYYLLRVGTVAFGDLLSKVSLNRSERAWAYRMA